MRFVIVDADGGQLDYQIAARESTAEQRKSARLVGRVECFRQAAAIADLALEQSAAAGAAATAATTVGNQDIGRVRGIQNRRFRRAVETLARGQQPDLKNRDLDRFSRSADCACC